MVSSEDNYDLLGATSGSISKLNKLTPFGKRLLSTQPNSNGKRSNRSKVSETYSLDTETKVEKLNLFGRPTYTKN
mgnify:CR=1 FL=1